MSAARQNIIIRILIGRVVTEQIILDQDRAGVDPEAVYAAAEPEPHNLGDSLSDLFVAPVQIRLLDQERMAVILLTAFIPLPGAAAKAAQKISQRSQSTRRFQCFAPRPMNERWLCSTYT